MQDGTDNQAGCLKEGLQLIREMGVELSSRGSLTRPCQMPMESLPFSFPHIAQFFVLLRLGERTMKEQSWFRRWIEEPG
jgi:hypothetical protein